MEHKLNYSTLNWFYSYMYSSTLNSSFGIVFNTIGSALRIAANNPVLDLISFPGAYRLSEIFSLTGYFQSLLSSYYASQANALLSDSALFADRLFSLKQDLDYIAIKHARDLVDLNNLPKGTIPPSGHIVIASLLNEGPQCNCKPVE